MSPQDLFAVALRVMGVWFICMAAVSVIGGVFAHLIAGIVLVLAGTAMTKGNRPDISGTPFR